MMTEENQGRFPDDPIQIMPAGNLWMDSPLFWRDIPAGEWEKAVEVLRDLMPLADHTTVALTIAMGDAVDRAREEAERAREREATPEDEKDRFGLSPAEAGRLKGLLRRCDAVGNARTFVEDHMPENDGRRYSVLRDLDLLLAELGDEFYRYRHELGVPPAAERSE